MWRYNHIWLLAFLLGVVYPGEAYSQRTGHTPAELQDIGVDEQLGEHIPLDLTFLDEEGREVQLGDYFDGTRPVVLTLTYHDCPMLCNLILDGFAQTLDGFAWLPGNEFEIVSVSFGEAETPEMALNQKERYMRMLERPGMEDGWHFLVGDSESIDALTEAVGFQYKWDERQQEYAHPAVLIFLGGDGMVSRYIYGIQFPQRQFRNALVEASEGKIGTTLDQVLLFCFQFDPNANSYVLHAANFMKLGGVLTVLILGAFLIILWRRDRRKIEAGTDVPALT